MRSYSKITWKLLGYSTRYAGASNLSIPIQMSIVGDIHELYVGCKYTVDNRHYKYSEIIISEDFIFHSENSHSYLFGMNNSTGSNTTRSITGVLFQWSKCNSNFINRI